MSGPAPLVFFDIAASEGEQQRAFYAGMFDWQIGDDMRFSLEAQASMQALLRVEAEHDVPIRECVLYFGVEDVGAALERAKELGGGVDFGPMSIPGMITLGLAIDPAGNRVGLVHWKDGAMVIPPAGEA